jgi:NAD(P)-dependent dehydrogenase (short-subunit alcohol dehydrogenase family)
MSDKVKGKIILITGGASGLGKEVAIRLAKLGGRIVIVDKSDPSDVVNELKRQGADAHGLKGDITLTEEVEKIFQLTEKVGGVDILLNNAGVVGSRVTGESGFYIGKGNSWKNIVAVNLTAAIEMSQHALQQMRKHRRGGVILNVASMAAIVPMRDGPIYCSTKAGLLQFSKSLVGLEESDNIRVVTICPSFTDTPMNAGVLEVVSRITGGILNVDDVVTGMVELVLDSEQRGTGAVMTVTVNRGREYPTKYNPRRSKL